MEVKIGERAKENLNRANLYFLKDMAVLTKPTHHY